MLDIILCKTIAIDQKMQSFYIMVMNRENKITIRLDPTTDPEKKDGVKIALALMAKRIQDVEKTFASYYLRLPKCDISNVKFNVVFDGM